MIISALTFIIFYPAHPKPSLNGTWYLEYCYTKGRDIAVPDDKHIITYNQLQIVAGNMHIRTSKYGEMDAKIGILENGYLVIRSEGNPEINGTYSMEIETDSNTAAKAMLGTSLTTVQLVSVDNHNAMTFSKSGVTFY